MKKYEAQPKKEWGLKSNELYVSFVVWCTLVDLFECKDFRFSPEDFETFKVSECTIKLYNEIIRPKGKLTLCVLLDEHNQEAIEKYVDDSLAESISESIEECFGNSVKVQFVIERF